MATEITNTPPEVDDPLVMDANYKFNRIDRRYIDDQIRGCETRIVELFVDGTGGTSLRTTDDIPVRVLRFPVSDGGVLTLRFIVNVKSTDNSGDVSGEWEIKAAYTVVGGVLAEAYVAAVTAEFTVGSPPDPTLSLNGDTDVDLNVTGIAATGLTWKVSSFNL